MSTRQRAFADVGALGRADRPRRRSARSRRRAGRGTARRTARRCSAMPKALSVCLRKVPPMPWLKSAIASGPCSRLDLLHLLGDVAERLVPGDLGPLLLAARRCARSSGARSRSGSKCAPTPPVPRGQSRPRESGSSGLPSIFHRTPSRTVAIALHFQKQRSQKVGTVRTAGRPAGIAAPSGPREVAASVAAPAPNPAILRNRRREMRFMDTRPEGPRTLELSNVD